VRCNLMRIFENDITNCSSFRVVISMFWQWLWLHTILPLIPRLVLLVVQYVVCLVITLWSIRRFIRGTQFDVWKVMSLEFFEIINFLTFAKYIRKVDNFTQFVYFMLVKYIHFYSSSIPRYRTLCCNMFRKDIVLQSHVMVLFINIQACLVI